MTVFFSCHIVPLLWCSGRLSDWKRLNSDRFEGFGVCEGRWNVIFPIQSHWISGKNRQTLEEDICSEISSLDNSHQNPWKRDHLGTKVQAKKSLGVDPANVDNTSRVLVESDWFSGFHATRNVPILRTMFPMVTKTFFCLDFCGKKPRLQQNIRTTSQLLYLAANILLAKRYRFWNNFRCYTAR